MRERERLGVQAASRGDAVESLVLLQSSIEDIADQRQPQRRGMHSDLMRAAGVREGAQHREAPAGRARELDVARLRGLGIEAVACDLEAVGAVRSQRLADNRVFELCVAMDQANVRLLDQAV